MAIRVFWTMFFAVVIILVLLVVGLAWLQCAPPQRMFAILPCNYGLTSSDFVIKAGATTAFLLFIAMIFGPIVASMKRAKGST